MLKIKRKRTLVPGRIVIPVVALLLVGGGAYALSLTMAPNFAVALQPKPIIVNELPAPSVQDNRIVIPKIGVNIPYGNGPKSLDSGSEWRFPERGNPETGGNFIIAAHRFSIQPTPMATIEKSPFFNIDKLVNGDKIIVDYKGVRYGYEISGRDHVKSTQVEIESPTEQPRLTLYSCELGGSDTGRVVVYAKPLGKVALTSSQSKND